jgi:hypothetical protein
MNFAPHAAIPKRIAPGDKFGVVALPKVWVATEMADELQLTSDLWITRHLPFLVDDFWQRTLGSLQAERLQEAKLFFVSSAASSNPDVLDAENKRLQHRVWLLYWGMLLSGFARFGTPIRLSGIQQSNHSEVRSVGVIETPRHTLGTPLQAVGEARLRLAGNLAEALSALLSNPKNERFSRVLHAFYVGISDPDANERLHQFARCVEGFILPDPGATARQFKSRTELFIGTGYLLTWARYTIFGARWSMSILHWLPSNGQPSGNVGSQDYSAPFKLRKLHGTVFGISY